MNSVAEALEQYLYIIFLFILLWNVYLSIKLGKITKRLNIFTKGAKISDIEQLVQDYTNEAIEMKKNISNNSNQINDNLNKICKLKGNIEVLRYNAFGEEGQDLSFSAAFLDDNLDGVVISSIYNRGVSSIYAKPVSKGKSSYKLSEEELKVIEQASNKN